MNIKDMRFLLHNYIANKEKLELLKREIELLRAMDSDNLKAVVYRDMPRSKTRVNLLEDLVIKRIDRVRDLESEIYSLTLVLNAIDSVYNASTGVYREIIKHRYMEKDNVGNGNRWNDVAEKIGYSVRYLTKIDEWLIEQFIHEYNKASSKKND